MESKKSPKGVKPLIGSPFDGSFLDAVTYQEDIIMSLSTVAVKSFTQQDYSKILSCFMETGHKAMIESPQAKKHAFAAFNEDLEMIACGINRYAVSAEAEEAGYPWGAHHAEFDLFSRHSHLSDVSFFVGVRVNRFREFRCSVPCSICSSLYGLASKPVYALDWGGNIVRVKNSGLHDSIGVFPGAKF